MAGLAAGMVAGAASTLLGSPGAAAQPVHLGIDLGAAHDLVNGLDRLDRPDQPDRLDPDMLDPAFDDPDGALSGQLRAYIEFLVYELLGN